MSAEPNSEPTPTTTIVSDPAPVTPAATEPVSANWRDSLSADHRDNQALADFKDVDALAKSFIHQGKMIGADKIALLNDESTQEDRDAFYTKLGRPAKAEDYDLAGVEIPEGLPWDGDFQNSMVEAMHGLGLNQSQVQGVLEQYVNAIGGQFQTQQSDVQQSRETGLRDLQNEWGKSYGAQVDLAKRAFMAGAGENFEAVAGMQMADGGMLGDHPDIIRAFASLGGKMSEHGLVGATATRTTVTPAEAASQISKLLSDSDFLDVYNDSQHREHDAAVKRILSLTEAQHSNTEG